MDTGQVLTTVKNRIKAVIHAGKLFWVKRVRAYDYETLVASIRDIGVEAGDVVMVHSAYSPYNGFQGSMAHVVLAVLEAVGPEGTVLMPSSPYSDSTEAYARSGARFNVKRSPSHLGIVTEFFRRRKNTLRSKNPAHPVLASGPLAEWFIEGHENFSRSCGPGTPFERLIETDAKVLFFDCLLTHLMFFHYLEDSIADDLPFDLYDPEELTIPVIDETGAESPVAVRVFSEETRRRRRFPALENELRKQGSVRDLSVGNTHLMLLRVRDAVSASQALSARGETFYSLDSA